MDLQRKMSTILELADRLDVRVRQVPLGGEGGGLCTIKGRKVLFVDSSADLATQCDRSLADFAQLPEIDNAYLMPELREELDRRRRG